MSEPRSNPPADELVEYRLAQVEARNGELSQEITKLRIKMDNRERERTAQERSFLIRGISFLGFIISILIGTICAYRGVIFQGKAP